MVRRLKEAGAGASYLLPDSFETSSTMIAFHDRNSPTGACMNCMAGWRGSSETGGREAKFEGGTKKLGGAGASRPVTPRGIRVTNHQLD